MADSFFDIEGPVTAVGKFVTKPEHTEEFAEHMRQWTHLVRSGLDPHLSTFEAFRYENEFFCIFQYNSAEDSLLVYQEVKARWLHVQNSFLAEEAEFQFFPTFSIHKPEE